MPQEYHRWIPTIITYICKAIAVSIAWYIQRIISAFHSAIRGGLMFSRGIMKYLNDKKIIDFDDTESILDEIVGWRCVYFVRGRVGCVELFLRCGAPSASCVAACVTLWRGLCVCRNCALAASPPLGSTSSSKLGS